MQRDGFTIENQLPVCRCERRHDFATTSTAAAMGDGSVSDGDVKHAVLDDFGNELYEAVRELMH